MWTVEEVSEKWIVVEELSNQFSECILPVLVTLAKSSIKYQQIPRVFCSSFSYLPSS